MRSILSFPRFRPSEREEHWSTLKIYFDPKSNKWRDKFDICEQRFRRKDDIWVILSKERSPSMFSSPGHEKCPKRDDDLCPNVIHCPSNPVLPTRHFDIDTILVVRECSSSFDPVDNCTSLLSFLQFSICSKENRFKWRVITRAKSLPITRFPLLSAKQDQRKKRTTVHRMNNEEEEEESIWLKEMDDRSSSLLAKSLPWVDRWTQFDVMLMSNRYRWSRDEDAQQRWSRSHSRPRPASIANRTNNWTIFSKTLSTNETNVSSKAGEMDRVLRSVDWGEKKCSNLVQCHWQRQIQFDHFDAQDLASCAFRSTRWTWKDPNELPSTRAHLCRSDSLAILRTEINEHNWSMFCRPQWMEDSFFDHRPSISSRASLFLSLHVRLQWIHRASRSNRMNSLKRIDEGKAFSRQRFAKSNEWIPDAEAFVIASRDSLSPRLPSIRVKTSSFFVQLNVWKKNGRLDWDKAILPPIPMFR